MIKRMSFVAGVAVAGMFVLASAAGAATCTPTSGNGNSNKQLFLDATLNGTDADAFCSQAGWDKNDKPSEIELRAPFGESDWILADKDNEAAGDQMIILSTTGVGSSTQSNPIGTWSLETEFTFAKLMITLKDAAGWGAFLLDPTDRSGTWWTEAGSLSHASIWYVGKSDEEQPSMVPLPAAGWMLIAGLGGLGAMRRFKKS
jgi:hypothetical protein